MQDLLGSASVSHNPHATTAIPKKVDEALGEPDEIVFFIDRDSGEITVVPASEVTTK